MPRVFKTFAADRDVLITEGTMLSRGGKCVMTEHEMQERARVLMQDNRYTFVLCSSTNIDSIAAFYHAAAACRRPFIVCDYQRAILDLVTQSRKSSFYNFDRRKVYTYGDNLHGMMREHGFCMLVRVNNAAEKALQAFPDNLLIYSLWEGYLDRSRPACDERKASFVEAAKAAGSRVVPLHTGGHATAEAIKQLIAITKPKVLIPIHCEAPEAFRALDTGREIKVLQDGEVYDLDKCGA